MPEITIQEARQRGIKSGHVHTILIPKTKNLQKAKEWLKSHGYHTRHRTTTNYYRMNQVPEITGARFATKTLPNGYMLVFQYFA